MHRSIHQLVCALALAVIVLPGQETVSERSSEPFTLKAAVDLAATNFPAIRASMAQVAEAESGIALAKTAYLPKADMRLGLNFATRNNVFGLIFPNNVIPGISGPVQDESTITSVFGSSAGVLLSYEPFDFGLRKANVQAAEAVRARAEAGRAVTEYEVELAAADAYLQAVAFRRAVQAAESSVERMEVFHASVDALAKTGLRPGADASRAAAELARSQSDLIRAQQAEQTALAQLAERLGFAGSALEINPAGLSRDPPAEETPETSLDAHPLALERQAEIAVGEARLSALEKEWRPRLQTQSAVYGRGTGARLDGTFHRIGYGLAPRQANWAVGFNVDFDLLEYKQNRANRRAASHRLEQERASRAVVKQELLGKVARAKIAVESARRIARNTPTELAAARALETQAQVRYKAGIGTVVEVADAQRLLRQAEVDDSLAKLDIWRALLALAAAQGDMDGMLTAASL